MIIETERSLPCVVVNYRGWYVKDALFPPQCDALAPTWLGPSPSRQCWRLSCLIALLLARSERAKSGTGKHETTASNARLTNTNLDCPLLLIVHSCIAVRLVAVMNLEHQVGQDKQAKLGRWREKSTSLSRAT